MSPGSIIGGRLVADHKIHTVGEKRLMRYYEGPKK